MRITTALVAILLLCSIAQARDVQLLNPDFFGQSTSAPIKLLYDRKGDEIEPYMVTTDIKAGKYHAASVFYGYTSGKVTFDEVRGSLNKLYRGYENLSLFQKSKSAHWRVDDKRFAISLSREDEGVVRVIYIQFRSDESIRKDISGEKNPEVTPPGKK